LKEKSVIKKTRKLMKGNTALQMQIYLSEQNYACWEKRGVNLFIYKSRFCGLPYEQL